MGMPQSPAMAEAQLFAEMDSQETGISNYTATFPLGGSSMAMQRWIGTYDIVIRGYDLLQSRCQRLEQQGWPRAKRRFDAKIADLAGARAKYVQMYSDKVAVERRQAGIWQDAAQFGTAQAMAANAAQQAAYGRINQGLHDVNEGRCWGCHNLYPVPGYNYCYKCGRQRRMWY